MKKFFILLIAIILSIGIIGCSDKGPTNLEEYYDISQNRGELYTRLNNENNENGSPYLKVAFEVKDNLMIYKYTFATIVQPETIAKSLEMKITEKTAAKEIDRLEELTGFSDISIQYIYYTPDNTEVFNRTFN